MYLPVVSLDRSQNVRIGKGKPDAIDRNDQGGSARLTHALYVDLNVPKVRRDLQNHSAIGAYTVVGPVTTKWCDLYASAAVDVVAGTGLTVDVPAFTLNSRLFPDQGTLSVAGATGVATPTLTTGDVIYMIQSDEYGNITAVPGGSSLGAPVYEVDSVAVTGTLTAGTFTLSFTYSGYNYVTAPIAYDATAAAVASAVEAATVTPSDIPNVPLPAGSVTGTGGPIGTAAVTLTASGALEGPISNQAINYSGVTGATGGSFTQSIPGVGASYPQFDGQNLPLAFVFVPENATAPSTITNIALTS